VQAGAAAFTHLSVSMGAGFSLRIVLAAHDKRLLRLLLHAYELFPQVLQLVFHFRDGIKKDQIFFVDALHGSFIPFRLPQPDLIPLPIYILSRTKQKECQIMSQSGKKEKYDR